MLPGAAPPNPVFASPVPANGTDGLRFAHRRAGGGETFFFTGYCHSIRWLPGLPGPDPGNFSLVGKVTKRTHEGETLSMGFLPRDPLFRDDTKGARVGTSSASLILPQASGFARCAAPPSSSANAPLVCLGAAPAGPFLPGFRQSASLARGQSPGQTQSLPQTELYNP